MPKAKNKGKSRGTGLRPAGGVLIRVRELDRCRRFYAGVLQLGPPVVDSNFWVEYVVDSQTSLILEQTNSARESAGGDIVWIFQVEHLRDFRDHLRRHRAGSLQNVWLANGHEAVAFLDPEGNQLMAVSARARPPAEPAAVIQDQTRSGTNE